MKSGKFVAEDGAIAAFAAVRFLYPDSHSTDPLNMEEQITSLLSRSN